MKNFSRKKENKYGKLLITPGCGFVRLTMVLLMKESGERRWERNLKT